MHAHDDDEAGHDGHEQEAAQEQLYFSRKHQEILLDNAAVGNRSVTLGSLDDYRYLDLSDTMKISKEQIA